MQSSSFRHPWVGTKSKCLSKPFARTVHRGLTTIEVIASAAILGLLITTTASLGLRVQKINRESQFELTAMNELANALDAQLNQHRNSADPSQLDGTTHKNEASDLIRKRWPDATILAEVSQDELGTRITLRLFRSNQPGIRPLELSGWVIAPLTAPEPVEQTEPTDTNAAPSEEQSDTPEPPPNDASVSSSVNSFSKADAGASPS